MYRVRRRIIVPVDELTLRFARNVVIPFADFGHKMICYAVVTNLRVTETRAQYVRKPVAATFKEDSLRAGKMPDEGYDVIVPLQWM